MAKILNNPNQVNKRLNKPYRIPTEYPTAKQQDYNTITINIANTANIAGFNTLSKFYGVKIGALVKKQDAEKENRKNNDINYYPDLDDNEQWLPFEPDAKPNQNGGYDKTPSWNGKMSSSLSGMPVLSYIKFIGGDYTDLQGNTVTIPDITFETVVISAQMNKDIKKTKITGRDTGTVKEINGMNDWSIEIRAIITADAPVNSGVTKKNPIGVYPRENIAEIWQMLKAPIAIPIECWFLQQFDINYICIEEGVRVEQIEGEYNMQRLVIPCSSDNPLIITVGA